MALLPDLKSDMSEDIAVFTAKQKEIQKFLLSEYPFIYRFLSYFAKEAVYFYSEQDVNYFVMRHKDENTNRLRMQLHKDFLLEFEKKYDGAIKRYLEECKRYLLEYGNDGYSYLIRADIYKSQDLTNYCADYFHYNWLQDKNYFIDRFQVLEKGKYVDIGAKHWIANNKQLTMDFAKAGKITFNYIGMLKNAVSEGRGIKTLQKEEQCMVKDGKWDFGFTYPEWIYTGGNLKTALPLYICHSFLKKFYVLAKAFIWDYQKELEARYIDAEKSYLALNKNGSNNKKPLFLENNAKLRLQNRKEIVSLATYRPLVERHGKLSYSKVGAFNKDQKNLIDKIYEEMAREDVVDLSTDAKFEEEFSKLNPTLQLMINLSAMAEKTELENGVNEWLKVLKKNPKLYNLVQENILLEYEKQEKKTIQQLNLCKSNMNKIDKVVNEFGQKEDKTIAHYERKFKKVLQEENDVSVAFRKNKAVEWTLQNAPQKLLQRAVKNATEICQLAGIDFEDNNEIMQIAESNAKIALYHKQVDARLTIIHMNIKNLKEEKQEAEKKKRERIRQCDKMKQTLYLKAIEQYSVGEKAGEDVINTISKLISSKNTSGNKEDKEMVGVLTKLYEYFNTKKVGERDAGVKGLIVTEKGMQNGEPFNKIGLATEDFMNNFELINNALDKLLIDPVKQEIQAIDEQIQTEEDDIKRIKQDIEMKTKLQTTVDCIPLLHLKQLQDIKARKLKNDLEKNRLEKAEIETNGGKRMKELNVVEASAVMDADFENITGKEM